MVEGSAHSVPAAYANERNCHARRVGFCLILRQAQDGCQAVWAHGNVVDRSLREGMSGGRVQARDELGQRVFIGSEISQAQGFTCLGQASRMARSGSCSARQERHR